MSSRHRVCETPVGETVLVNKTSGKIHKLLVEGISRCGARSGQLEPRPFADAVADAETERCGVCFEGTSENADCQTLSTYDRERFTQYTYGTVKGFARSRPCEICFQNDDGEVVEPADETVVMAIDTKKRRCVHRVPATWDEVEHGE